MALQHSVTVNDVTYPAAYSRITSFRGDKDTVGLYVCTYATEAARWADEWPITTKEYETARATVNGDLFPMAYDYLKTLPDFEGSVTVPDSDEASAP